VAKKGDKRKIVGLVSEESGERIYYTTKNTQNTTEKLALRKYSPKLRKHVVFTETKKKRSPKALISHLNYKKPL
jgi:large subunit ribosomal protein L33